MEIRIATGCGSAWLERLIWDQEAAGSNAVTPIHGATSSILYRNTAYDVPQICGCSSMVEHQPSKLDTWVRFPSPAFFYAIVSYTDSIPIFFEK